MRAISVLLITCWTVLSSAYVLQQFQTSSSSSLSKIIRNRQTKIAVSNREDDRKDGRRIVKYDVSVFRYHALTCSSSFLFFNFN